MNVYEKQAVFTPVALVLFYLLKHLWRKLLKIKLRLVADFSARVYLPGPLRATKVLLHACCASLCKQSVSISHTRKQHRAFRCK